MPLIPVEKGYVKPEFANLGFVKEEALGQKLVVEVNTSNYDLVLYDKVSKKYYTVKLAQLNPEVCAKHKDSIFTLQVDLNSEVYCTYQGSDLD
jgi:hypothetical protein